jgi:hypothetical protein
MDVARPWCENSLLANSRKGGERRREGGGIEEIKEEKSSERKKIRGNRKRPRGPRWLSGW